MDEPIIMLLEDHECDAEKVGKVMHVLERNKVISYKVGNKNALDFFSDEDAIPSVIIMFMNSPNLVSVEFAENAYLLQLDRFASDEWGLDLNCMVMPSGVDSPLHLIDFLRSICNSKEFIFCTAN